LDFALSKLLGNIVVRKMSLNSFSIAVSSIFVEDSSRCPKVIFLLSLVMTKSVVLKHPVAWFKALVKWVDFDFTTCEIDDLVKQIVSSFDHHGEILQS